MDILSNACMVQSFFSNDFSPKQCFILILTYFPHFSFIFPSFSPPIDGKNLVQLSLLTQFQLRQCWQEVGWKLWTDAMANFLVFRWEGGQEFSKYDPGIAQMSLENVPPRWMDSLRPTRSEISQIFCNLCFTTFQKTLITFHVEILCGWPTGQ